MSGLAMMFFQHPSLLSFQRAMEKKRQRSNLETIFGVSRVPSDTQRREMLDGTEIEGLRRLLPELFERMRRSGWTVQFRTEIPMAGGEVEKHYTMPLDGTDYFPSTKIQCPHCLRRSDAGGQEHYRHTVLSASWIKADARRQEVRSKLSEHPKFKQAGVVISNALVCPDTEITESGL